MYNILLKQLTTFSNYDIIYVVRDVKEGDGMADKNTLNEIRRNIEGYVGQQVTLKANKGRKRTMIREGVLENTYPSIFVVRINGDYNSVRRVSYSYSDILTEAVEVTVSKDNHQIKVS